ncbi:MAG: ribonuclease H-like domain-containing protein, partial [Acidimicrobiia bacterium]|nr:ribonuclease H-like domain-containing protein [Acidimicrobiia bacterium]
FVDLLKVVQRSIITGGSLGLKTVAPLAGFQWRDDDAGGEQSMVWYRAAVDDSDENIREANRERILRYNEDDVRATAALREWLSSVELPRIKDWMSAV